MPNSRNIEQFCHDNLCNKKRKNFLPFYTTCRSDLSTLFAWGLARYISQTRRPILFHQPSRSVDLFITAHRQSCGKVMFSVICVCFSVYKRVPPYRAPASSVQHPGSWTCSNLFNLDLTVQGSLPPHILTCSL